MKKLPIMAQFSPIRDIMIRDINLDGNMDLVLAGNNYAVRPTYGRYDASYGWCLLNDSANVYKTLMPVTVVKVLETKYDANVIGWTIPLNLYYLKNENRDPCLQSKAAHTDL
jgi:hypothetical protein